MKRKFFAALLILCILATAVPISASAANTASAEEMFYLYGLLVGEDTHTVTYVYNCDGMGVYKTETVKDGNYAHRPADPCRTGFAFAGWYTHSNGGSGYGFKTAVKKDITLYAHWIAADIIIIDKHVCEYTYVNNKDGTHTGTCLCSETITEDCTFEEGSCSGCGVWDGKTVDATWYDSEDPKTKYELNNAAMLDGLSQLVDEGNDFSGVTFTLTDDINLEAYDENGERVSFTPIGKGDAPFKGTFDGNGNSIENLYQSGWAFGYEWGSYGSVGLFGNVEDATIKNVTVSGAESFVEGGDVGGICGSAEGNCTFENITISDSSFATYNNGNGGIIGWSGAGSYTFKNITITEDVTLAGLWGSFDSSIGGVVGQGEPGATYSFENVNIACRLDVYNDCTASYDYYNYRMCGMIIGRLQETTTINGNNYPDTSKYNITCKAVTVTYGEWANYHYCDPTPGYNNGRGLRVEAGYSYDGIPDDYDHSQCTTHCKELIEFDQIFGGAQYGVKGLPSYEGVTVVYNNRTSD